jgi:dGTPase
VGEATLNHLMQHHGGYDHQKQTYRIITDLERRYPDHPGLNLTYEVREGVVKHDTAYDLVDAGEYSPHEKGTLECQLANLADEIAYNTSDMDDGLRSGILEPAAVCKLEISKRVLASLGEDEHADLSQTMLRHRFVRRLVGIEISNTIEATEANIKAAGIKTLDELRHQPGNVATYTPEMQELNLELKQYLFKYFYRHFRVVRMATKAERLIRDLFTAYIEQPLQLPLETQLRAEQHEEGLHRVVCDYIAGMTDRYAIQEHKRLYDPEERA